MKKKIMLSEAENKSTRIKKSGVNIFFSLMSSIIMLFFSFYARTVFINLLSKDYLGLNGLFSNILSFLALAELGIGSAMNFALYKPVCNDDKIQIQSLMKLYKKLYTSIGIFILVVGVSITPFLQYLIKDMPDIKLLHWYYVLYVLNSAFSYFFTYKRSLIICKQKEYISFITSTVAKILTIVLQIIVLCVFKSYTVYLMVAILMTVLENIIISKIANKMYPYITEKRIPDVEEKTKKGIFQNIHALVFHKVGAAIVFSTDNIIISKCVGLEAVGLYSNYTLIVNAINGILAKMFNSIIASTGELVVTSEKGHLKQVFNRILFANAWLYGLCATCFYCLLQPFISFWAGEDYLLSNSAVLIISINFYLTGMRKTTWIFKDAAGIYRQDRYKPLIEAIINLLVSIPLALKFGIAGVLLGTIVSTITWAFWFEAYVLFRDCFGGGMHEFVRKQIMYGIIWSVVGFGCYRVCDVVKQGLFTGLIIRAAIAFIGSNIVMIMLFYRSEEFAFYKGVFSKMHNGNFR